MRTLCGLRVSGDAGFITTEMNWDSMALSLLGIVLHDHCC